MKTKEYILKYELNISSKFNHSEFVQDMTIDLLSLIETSRNKNGEIGIKGFDNSVRALRQKWDAVNNKTVGFIPEKLWNYFYATVVVKLREEFCPKDMANRRRQQDEWRKQKQERANWYRDQNEWEERAYSDMFNSYLASLFSRMTRPVSSFIELELEQTATIEEVKKQYRKLSMVHHPDKGGKKDKFLSITEAKNKCMMYLEKQAS